MQGFDSRTLSFDEWVKAVFGHPVETTPWYYNCDFIEPAPKICLDYLTKLFTAPEILDEYLDEQVRDGLYFLISNACSSHTIPLCDQSCPMQQRIDCVHSMQTLFAEFLAKRCSEHLSHLDQAGANPINSVAYMWWDILPLCGRPDDRSFQKLDEAALDVMQQNLQLDSTPCRESALHGLGHWHLQYPGKVESIVDLFLKTTKKSISPELETYARAARQGCVN